MGDYKAQAALCLLGANRLADRKPRRIKVAVLVLLTSVGPLQAPQPKEPHNPGCGLDHGSNAAGGSLDPLE